MTYIAEIYVNGTIERILTDIVADSEKRAIGHAYGVLNENTKYSLKGASVRIEVIEQKQEPVTAEEWVDTYYKFYKNCGGNLKSGEKEMLLKTFKAGGSNTNLLYAELMEAAQELINTLNPGMMMMNFYKHLGEALEKIKEHNASI